MAREAGLEVSADDARRTGARRGSGRRRPWWVRLLVLVVLVLGVQAVVDRVAAAVTARRLPHALARTQHLSARPDVSIGGWPFLTQVIGGSYSDVAISAPAPIGAAGVRVSDTDVHLHGVRGSLADAVHGTVTDLPVASGRGTARLTYRELDAIIARYVPSVGSQITVTGAGRGRARLHEPLGLTLDVTARIARGRLTVTPDAAQLAALPALVREPLQAALAHPVTLPQFPFHVHLVRASLEPDGIHLFATARDSVFPVR